MPGVVIGVDPHQASKTLVLPPARGCIRHEREFGQASCAAFAVAAVGFTPGAMTHASCRGQEAKGLTGEWIEPPSAVSTESA